jgi:hypothetical protein
VNDRLHHQEVAEARLLVAEDGSTRLAGGRL